MYKLFLSIALFCLCVARAQAAAEFCPGQVGNLHSSNGASQATSYTYDVQALTDRTIEGTIIADTDHGWYSWKQAPAQLVATRFTSLALSKSFPPLEATYILSQSGDLSVNFPVELQVYRAWITSAQTHGEAALHWDASGVVSCDPTDFAPHEGSTRTVKRTPNAGDPTPPPVPPAAMASATVAPFPPSTCDKPFVSASVTHASEPTFPQSVKDSGFTQRATSEIEVAVGPDGKLVDAWLFASSGYPQLDESAMLAAKRSTYAPAISYCKTIGASYLFRATFLPHR